MLTKDLITSIYNNVFRATTHHTGFYYLDLGTQLDSKAFRQLMVDIKNALSTLCQEQLKKDLHYQSLGRFNHQSTSKPHRDTADNHSFLMLGYEPTQVESTAYITDYSKYIEQEGMSIHSFFGEDTEANLMSNPAVLEDYKTEIKPFQKEHYRILMANNSRSYEESTFGVFHSAHIPHKSDRHDRILNYMMLRLSDLNSKEQYSIQDVQHFISTDTIDR